MRDRSASFWVSLTLQTAALMVAANANQLAAAEAPPKLAPEFSKEFLFDDPGADAFLYNVGANGQDAYVDHESAWLDARTQARFDAPVLLEQSDRLLLGAIDHWNGAPADDDDWLFAY